MSVEPTFEKVLPPQQERLWTSVQFLTNVLTRQFHRHFIYSRIYSRTSVLHSFYVVKWVTMWLFKNCICTVSTSCLLNFSKITSLLIHPYKMSVELTFDKFYLRLLQLHQRVPRSPAYVFLAKVSSTVILYSRIGKSPLWEFIPLYKCVPGSPAKGKTLYSHFINLVTSWLVWISESELSRSALPCMCVTWLMHVCDMTHACVWHDCCIHARVSHGYSLFQSESWILIVSEW